MALLKIKCPECNAGLKSPTGFTAGQTVCCPKCETYFAVEEPAEEEEEETEPNKEKAGKKTVKAAVADDDDEEEKKEAKPKKKKKKKAVVEDDEEGSYSKSPLRFIILGVLVLVMIVLGVMLYLKKQREAAEEKRRDDEAAAAKAREDAPPAPIVPKKNEPPKKKNEPTKKNEPLKKGGKGAGLDLGAVAGDAMGGLLSGGPITAEEAQALRQKYTAALAGTWAADLGGGVTEELAYKPDGTFTARRTGAAPATADGKYTVTMLVGTKGLRLQLDTSAGTRAVTVVFEDNELLHPSLQPGVVAVFRKK